MDNTATMRGETPRIIVSRQRLSKPQSKIFHSRAPITLDMGGQRGGKSQMIGILSGLFVRTFPKLKGFIAANTYMQLSQSTLTKCFEIWAKLYNLTQYHEKKNPNGDFVIDRMPPAHFTQWALYPRYDNIISFKNGHVIYIGSLDNYKAHDGKEFAYAHLDETKDTREEALTSVIMGRLSQRGLFYDPKAPNAENLLYFDVQEQDTGGVMYVDSDGNLVDTKAMGLIPHTPLWIHTSPAVGQVDWLIKMFGLDGFEREIMKAVINPNDFYYQEVRNGERLEKTIVIFSTYWNDANLPENYIANRKATLTENGFLKFICGYPFAKMGGEYYAAFERQRHVQKLEYLMGRAIHTCWDFNVVPYMTMVAAQIQTITRYRGPATREHPRGKKYYEPGKDRIPQTFTQVRFFKEYCLESPLNSTDAIITKFRGDFEARHNAQPFDCFIYGDASGRNRIPGLGDITNYSRIENMLGYWVHNQSMRVPRANVSPLTRRELFTLILEDKLNIEVIFDESVEKTIQDMEYLKLGTDGKNKERTKHPETGVVYEKLGHTSDAIEGLIFYLFGEYLEN